MRVVLRTLLAAAVVTGVAATAVPASAHEHYQCVRYPCYPEDYPVWALDTVMRLIGS